MLGLMMQEPLRIAGLLEHAEKWHADTEIVSRLAEGGMHRYTYAGLGTRSRQLAHALARLGIQRGDRVGTLAWNTHRHLELYYAVSGSAAVCHTINPRLFFEQLVYIINHAEDRLMFFDLTFLPLVEKLAINCPKVESWVLLTDRAHMPEATSLPDLRCYEDLLATENDEYAWPYFDENTASSLCYTSGTTDQPKGVLYSHRSTLLHSYAASLPDCFNCSARDTVLPVVPMFHVNAWGIPYVAPLNGCKLVLPGPGLDAASLYELYETEGVTFTAGVPTIWFGLLTFMREKNLQFTTLRRMIVGGASCPPALLKAFDEELGVEIRHAWGMSETSPLGTVCTLKTQQLILSPDEQFAIQTKQGRAIFGVDMKIVDDAGQPLPHDGVAFGDLLVRGPFIVAEYFRAAHPGELTASGWFRTGDVATIDPNGFMQITDRSKDVIKSGGEWISSIELENLAIGHPHIAEAAVIGVPHPKWSERPLLVVVRKPEATITAQELLAFYDGKVARWWIPEAVEFVTELPHTATGKLLKTKLRQDFAGYSFPG
ncbi:long-chain-fatty-acid--CoA ligase [Microvirga sp. STR05]|uniref:Long-chain-fatty-acid--CoA ligase n=1 Tax=Hymenobacter duratus TaxID=2771356 RepID=A0ABR8JH61_9BACT|nr:3-(methylthio)propionyl-CoA ligase [Hymenobacter duratus]MBD2714933.1 long-chain-fatty-acid--CoA ligase [Hymenobacter duratus]MBR7949839.1 long-chain-fatty-acid--CoA ligase [Microvirga sp. STR05]